MKRFVVFAILAIVVICSCAAQSATNDAQRFVGTWVSESGGMTFVFNANGTGTASGFSNPRIDGNIFWGISITTGQIAVIYANGTYETGNFFPSPDGGRMIFFGGVYQKR